MIGAAPVGVARIRRVHQILFCLNLGFAVAFVVTVLLMTSRLTFVHGRAESPDLFRQVLIAINMRLGRVPWDPLGAKIGLITLALLFFVILFLLSNLILRTRAAAVTLNAVAGIAAICAVPIAWFPYESRLGTYSSMDRRAWYGVALELAVIGGALYMSWKRANPLWFGILVVHYAVWGWFLSQGAWSSNGAPLLDWGWAFTLSLIAPCAGFVWVSYVTHNKGAGIGKPAR